MPTRRRTSEPTDEAVPGQVQLAGDQPRKATHMEEIYTHRFVVVEDVGGPAGFGSYDVMVRDRDGNCIVVEAVADEELALDVASSIATAFDSWSVKPTTLSKALLASAEVLWSAVSEGCPFDEIVDHVSDLLRGILPAELADAVIEWADVNECSLEGAIAALHDADIHDGEVAK